MHSGSVHVTTGHMCLMHGYDPRVDEHQFAVAIKHERAQPPFGNVRYLEGWDILEGINVSTPIDKAHTQIIGRSGTPDAIEAMQALADSPLGRNLLPTEGKGEHSRTQSINMTSADTQYYHIRTRPHGFKQGKHRQEWIGFYHALVEQGPFHLISAQRHNQNLRQRDPL